MAANDNRFVWRSCWNCNSSHEGLKRAKYVINCFECGRWFYLGVDITEREKENTNMQTKTLVQKHDLDEIGNPAGGATRAKGILIDWQDGPLGRGAERREPNGAFVEDVIKAVIGRLEFYQTASNRKFACRENAIALTHLETALLWLEKRTRDREERAVEGTNTP